MHVFIRQRFEIQFVNRVACVGNQFAQKNFLIGVNGVNHQIQHALGFGFKLLFCHRVHLWIQSGTACAVCRVSSFPLYSWNGKSARYKLILALCTCEC